MSLLERLESDLRLRQPGWWERLSEVIPELRALADTPQPPEFHAEGDVAIHTRMAIEACPDDCDPDLRWVALLHDIGKPDTTKHNEGGRITAHGHAKVGSEMAGKVLAQLGMPEERARRIVWTILNHMFHHSWQLKVQADLSKKQRHVVIDPNFPLLLEFLRIDTLASHGKPGGLQVYEFYRQLWEDQRVN